MSARPLLESFGSLTAQHIQRSIDALQGEVTVAPIHFLVWTFGPVIA
jgi:hypothetical protein